MRPYQPPFQLPHRMTALVADIAERLGAWKAANPGALLPELRRGNRIRTLQASLAIEQNTLRSEEHTSELQSLMRTSYAVFCLKKKKNNNNYTLSITKDQIQT